MCARKCVEETRWQWTLRSDAEQWRPFWIHGVSGHFGKVKLQQREAAAFWGRLTLILLMREAESEIQTEFWGGISTGSQLDVKWRWWSNGNATGLWTLWPVIQSCPDLRCSVLQCNELVDPNPKWVAIIKSNAFLILPQNPGLDDRFKFVHQDGRRRSGLAMKLESPRTTFTGRIFDARVPQNTTVQSPSAKQMI